MTDSTATKIHPFEAAGLGIAPFTFVGAIEKRGPQFLGSENGVERWAGAPGQPMGTCEFCGQGIAICCTIRDSLGATFIVGSDCVKKVYATGTRVRADVERALHTAKLAKDQEKIAAARERLANDEALRARLAAAKSPNVNRPQDSALAWAEWMMANAGTSGRMEVVRVLARIAPAE